MRFRRHGALIGSTAGGADRPKGVGVEVLVNNGGFSWFGPTADLDAETFEALFPSNVRARYLLVSAIAPKMAERGSGSIINLASMAGTVGLAGGAAYGATKASLSIGLCRRCCQPPARAHVRADIVQVVPPRYHRPMAMNLRLDDDRSSLLREVADEEGRSQQEIVKLALDEYFARRSHVRRREEAIDRIVAKNADLNELLAR